MLSVKKDSSEAQLKKKFLNQSFLLHMLKISIFLELPDTEP